MPHNEDIHDTMNLNEQNSSPENTSSSSSAPESNTPVSVEAGLESLESMMQEIEILENSIEAKAQKGMIEAGSPHAREKHSKILQALGEKKNAFLKKISDKFAQATEKIVAPFRDRRIEKDAVRFREKLDESVAMKKYDACPELNPEFVQLKETARAEFRAYEASITSMLSTLETETWGKSKNKEAAFRAADLFLNSLMSRATLVDDEEMVFRALSIHEKMSATKQVKTDSHVDQSLYSMVVYLRKKHVQIEEGSLAEVYRNNPYLILTDIRRHSSFDREMTPLITKCVDRIIEDHPNGARLPSIATQQFEAALKLQPEKYALDTQKRTMIFETIKQSESSSHFMNKLADKRHFFGRELAGLSSEEIHSYIKPMSSWDIQNIGITSNLISLPLNESHFSVLYSKLNDRQISGKQKPYSKEAFLSLLVDVPSGDNKEYSIPLFNHEYFDLDPATRLDYFKKRVAQGSPYFSLLHSTFSHFQTLFAGIKEEDYREEVNNLITLAIRSNIADIRALWTLLPEYDIPGEYKQKAIEAFAHSVSRNDSNTFKQLFAGQGGSELSWHREWLKGNSEILSELEKEFYKEGRPNDLRHFFYEVLSGKRTSVDFDLLVREYAQKDDEITTEEIVDLFYVQKKIPESYLPLFMPKLDSAPRFLSQIDDLVRLGDIPKEEYSRIILSGIEFGGALFADKLLEYSLEENLIPDDKRAGVFKTFAQSLAKHVEDNPQNAPINFVIQWMTKNNAYEKITDEEKTLLFKGIFDNLESRHLHLDIVSMASCGPASYDFFDRAFPDSDEKRAFVEKIFESNDPRVNRELFFDYWSNQLIDQSGTGSQTNPIFALLTKERIDKVFDKGLELGNLRLSNEYLNYFEVLSDDQKNRFFEAQLKKEDLFSKDDDTSEIKQFCVRMGKRIMSGISPDTQQALYLKLFSSEFVTPEALFEIGCSDLFPEGNTAIFAEYLRTIEAKGDSPFCLKILNYYTSQDTNKLSAEQVKNLSLKILSGGDLDGLMYQMYLDSTPTSPKFYLDAEVLTKAVDKMLVNIFDKNSIAKLLLFLNKQRATQGQEGLVTLSSEQESSLVKAALGSVNCPVSGYEQLYDFDPEKFADAFKSVTKAQSFRQENLEQLLRFGKKSVLENLSRETIAYCFSGSVSAEGILEALAIRFGEEAGPLAEIKQAIEKIPLSENRWPLKSILLNRDLFDVNELRESYNAMRGDADVRSQVLLAAEMLGSLACVPDVNKLSGFFEKNNQNAERRIKEISAFIQKYPLEKKGRTIAVMLFAKEYLPERSSEEVIEKVGEQLSKYERILNQYKYENVPAQLGTSLGFEYEITGSTASGYKALTGNSLKRDIVRLSKAAHIGSGRDAVHEVAVRPAINPYLLILEAQLLHDLEYIDFNFDRSPDYQKGSRGYHLTAGGERGLSVNANTHFLQNALLAASWGGVHTGETGKRVSGGRGVTLRERAPDSQNNVQMFDEPTTSTELRSLSVDRLEPFQRVITTTYHAGIAIQAFEKYTSLTSDRVAATVSGVLPATPDDLIDLLQESKKLKVSRSEIDAPTRKILYAWVALLVDFDKAVKYHNEEFLSGETAGYLDKESIWNDTDSFGGADNHKRFESVVASIDPTLSVAEYVNTTQIKYDRLFSSFSTELADSFTKINNLYLKPSITKTEEDGTKKSRGDQANALAMLAVTKLDNETLERRDEPLYLNGTVFDTYGERREGYYNIQGASERMLTHAAQRALLTFNKKMEQIVN
ncbi:MAG: hypothetical protein WCG55_04125 [bacterium]